MEAFNTIRVSSMHSLLRMLYLTRSAVTLNIFVLPSPPITTLGLQDIIHGPLTAELAQGMCLAYGTGSTRVKNPVSGSRAFSSSSFL